MQQENMDDLIIKYLKNLTSAQEDDALLSWVNENAENKAYFISQQKMFMHAPVSKADFDVDTADELKQVFEKANIRTASYRKLYYAVAAIAASVIVVLGIFFLNNNKPVSVPTLITANDSIQTNTLMDGSMVSIDENSQILVSSFENDTIRKIVAHGRTFFEVAKDSSKPFVIDVDYVQVRVLGTKFEIEENLADKTISVSVIEGRVQVLNTLTNKSVILSAMETCTMMKKDDCVKQTLPNQNFLAWHTGKLVFENTPMREAIIDLSDYYNKTFTLATDKVGDCELNGTFNYTDFEDAKKIISIALAATVSEQDSVVVIDAKDCE